MVTRCFLLALLAHASAGVALDAPSPGCDAPTDPKIGQAVETLLAIAHDKMQRVLVYTTDDGGEGGGVDTGTPDKAAKFNATVHDFVRNGMPMFERGVRLAEKVLGGKGGCAAIAAIARTHTEEKQCKDILTFVGEGIATSCEWIWRPRHHDDLTYTADPMVEFCVGDLDSKTCLPSASTSCLLPRPSQRAFWRARYLLSLRDGEAEDAAVRVRADGGDAQREGFRATRISPREGGIFFVHFAVKHDDGGVFPPEIHHHPTLQVRGDVPRFANELGLVGEGVEIGVCFGNHAEALLRNWRGRRLFLVDPWRSLQEERILIDPAEEVRYPKTAPATAAAATEEEEGEEPMTCESERAMYYTRARILRAGIPPDRFQIIRATSAEAAAYFVDGQLDFVYIARRDSAESTFVD